MYDNKNKRQILFSSDEDKCKINPQHEYKQFEGKGFLAEYIFYAFCILLLIGETIFTNGGVFAYWELGTRFIIGDLIVAIVAAIITATLFTKSLDK